LSPRTASPVENSNKLAKDIKKSFGLLSDGDRLFLGIAIICLMELVQIFSTPTWIRECYLELPDAFLHFTFPMNWLSDSSFRIDSFQ